MPLKPVAGEWYIAATCDDCKCRILLFPDLNNGDGNINGYVYSICPDCGCEANFALEHYLHEAETAFPG